MIWWILFSYIITNFCMCFRYATHSFPQTWIRSQRPTTFLWPTRFILANVKFLRVFNRQVGGRGWGFMDIYVPSALFIPVDELVIDSVGAIREFAGGSFGAVTSLSSISIVNNISMGEMVNNMRWGEWIWDVIKKRNHIATRKSLLSSYYKRIWGNIWEYHHI